MKEIAEGLNGKFGVMGLLKPYTIEDKSPIVINPEERSLLKFGRTVGDEFSKKIF